jgi:very-long-chain (3R)-3-hydroxyacyl-CoA dehydratase
MDRPGDSHKPAPRSKQDQQPVKVVPPSYRTLYLILYNSVSALLWSVVLGRTLLNFLRHGHENVYLGAGGFTKWTQTLAGLEVLHAAIGTATKRFPRAEHQPTNFRQASSAHPSSQP